MSRSDARKPESDKLPYLSIVYMQQQGVITDDTQSAITTEWGQTRSSKVSVLVSLKADRLMMISFDINSSTKQQRVSLCTTPCNYGGIRWWFKCPFCYKRVGKLFLYGDQYACRHCHDLTYKSRMKNPRSSLRSLFNRVERNEKARDLLSGMRTISYNGKPTKRYLKILELTDEEYED